ncbi:ion transporter [Leucothrix pacifica]|uniref:Ion transporter n=1 Tax=Leucothrix pacifica TaxID=1247513 RepID=A0A317CFG1_9GAMM|nr:ion transporter [Leucothrix pacifica]
MIEIFIINSALIAGAVLIHYEVLFRLTRLIPKLTFLRSRLRILVGVFGALVAHVAEVWLFAFAYYFMLDSGRYGSLEGNFNGTLMDASYFSFTTYTSLGFGDIEPLGDIRFLVGLEALTGLVLITWTASFMFIEMQRFWIIQSDS